MPHRRPDFASLLQLVGMLIVTSCCLLITIGIGLIPDWLDFSELQGHIKATGLVYREVSTYIIRSVTPSPSSKRAQNQVLSPSPLEPTTIPSLSSTPTEFVVSTATPTLSPSPTTRPTRPTATATPAPTQTAISPQLIASLLQTPSSRFSQPEQPATRLMIPALSLDIPVFLAPIVEQTWAVQHLQWAAGHLEGTASPGDDNNLVLAAHMTLAPDSQPGPFFALHQLQRSQEIRVYVEDQVFTYQVEDIYPVKPSDISVTYPTDVPRLTLITCLTYNAILERYEDRLIVVAGLQQ